MTVQFSVTSQLTLVLAWASALALAGQMTQAASIDPISATLSTKYESALPSDPFLQEQKLIPGKDARILIVRTSESTKPALSKSLVSGKGVVLKVDRANGTVKINHESIPALDWPEMIKPFRLKESGLADQVKEGDKVEFFLEKSGSDYVIVKWQK
ncbi:MAG: copper-binding protein [Nitrosospira sp.]|nr:copper-binding protein [Nitrosospira sp.]